MLIFHYVYLASWESETVTMMGGLHGWEGEGGLTTEVACGIVGGY